MRPKGECLPGGIAVSKGRSFILWLVAFALTLIIAAYQRLSGPTHPLRGEETVGGHVLTYKFLRSYTAMRSLPVTVAVSDRRHHPRQSAISADLLYRRYPTGENWAVVPMKPGSNPEKAESLGASIPGQPAAGKVEYRIRIYAASLGLNSVVELNRGRAVVARFKNEVPIFLLIPHITLMFLGLLFAVRTGIEAMLRIGDFRRPLAWTLACMFIGGLILGPLVQKHAFGAFWTGFPLGTDLTDTKALIIFIAWLLAFLFRKKSRWWAVAALVVMIALYLIPHSLFGSELNYRTGKVESASVSGYNPKLVNVSSASLTRFRMISFTGRISPTSPTLWPAISEPVSTSPS